MTRKYRILVESMADESTRYRIQFNDSTPHTIWKYVTDKGGVPLFSGDAAYRPFDFRALADAKAEIDRDIAVRKSITVVNQTMVEYP